MELLDTTAIAAINAYSRTALQVAPTLFFEFHGSPSAVEEAARAVQELAADQGAGAFSWETTPEGRARLWEARHTAYWAARALRPGCQGFPTDVCVPVSRLVGCVCSCV